MSGRGAERGQSTVELVAMLPLLLVIMVAVAQLLVAGAAAQYAEHAAEAGAIAKLEGGDAPDAVRAAVPGWSRSRLEVSVHGRTVKVAVRPAALVPVLARLLTAHAEATAGG